MFDSTLAATYCSLASRAAPDEAALLQAIDRAGLTPRSRAWTTGLIRAGPAARRSQAESVSGSPLPAALLTDADVILLDEPMCILEGADRRSPRPIRNAS